MSWIEEGSRRFHSEISSTSLVLDLLKEHQFIENVGEILIEAGEIEDCTRCSYQARGLKVDGYYYDSDTSRLNLIVALWKDEIEEAKARVTKTEIEDTFRRCLNFFNRSLANLSEKIEIANEAHTQMEQWMEHKAYNSIDEIIGKLSYKNIEKPMIYERAQFMKYYHGE